MSQFFVASFARACSSTSFVSAAKPTDEEISRWWKRFQNVACRNELERKSFVTLFDFLFGHARRFVIETAAHITSTSQSSTASCTAAHISSLVITLTNLAPAGRYKIYRPGNEKDLVIRFNRSRRDGISHFSRKNDCSGNERDRLARASVRP
jgi:hypothetical protein